MQRTERDEHERRAVQQPAEALRDDEAEAAAQRLPQRVCRAGRAVWAELYRQSL